MSLLIKALDKAQSAKTEQAQVEKSKKEQADKNKAELKIEADASTEPHTHTSQNQVQAPAQTRVSTASTGLELSLSPTGSSFSETVVKPANMEEVPVSKAPATASSNQQFSSQHAAAKSAANVFSAKGVEAKTDSARLAVIAGAGLIALLGMGLYFYQFVDTAPPIVLPPRPLEQIATIPQTAPQTIPVAQNADTNMSGRTAEPLETAPSAIEATMPPAFEPAETKLFTSSKKTKKTTMSEDDTAIDDLEDSLENTSLADESRLTDEDGLNRLQASFSANNANKKPRKSKNNTAIASESASIRVTKSTPQPSVNPVLMSAYEAYNAGKDTEAQQLYKQVLKRDIRNIDALLGLGAIAARQGRSADATAWYSKVLEVDPRNNIAQAALLDNQSQGNELTNETSLKNMLAKQPDDANLYVALGNLYAEQNQWPAAQQAYFDAYSLNKTADNAYNLAVSLDQMGKSKLALPYYQRALAQANHASNIDKAALAARIAAIQ